MEKEEKIGLTTINWIVCIGGILILLCFIILPPALRAFASAEEEKNPPVVEEAIQMRCVKTTELEGIVKGYEYFLDGKGENLNMLSYTATENYLTIPEEIQATCNVNNINYQNVEGLYYACEVTENKMVVESRVTFSDYQGSYLPFMINFGQDYSLILSDLTRDGFTCNEVK